jgi:hypothetical protein
MLPFYAVMIVVLMFITFIPQVTMSEVLLTASRATDDCYTARERSLARHPLASTRAVPESGQGRVTRARRTPTVWAAEFRLSGAAYTPINALVTSSATETAVSRNQTGGFQSRIRRPL